MAPADLRRSERRRRGRLLGPVGGPVLLVVVAAAGIWLLAEATQTRPEPARPGWRTAVVLDVRLREDRPPIDAANALWGACQWMVRRRLTDDGIQQLDTTRFRLVVTRELGELGRQRLRGCLEDATIDRIQGHVVSMEALPPG